MDIVESEEEREKIMDFVREHARKTLGTSPQVFALGAKDAYKAKQEKDKARLEKSGLPALENYIKAILAASERLKLKLSNPLGVAQHLTDNYQQVIKDRLELLKDDRKTLEEVDRQLIQFEKDMKREFENYIARVKTVLLEVERRGDMYFDDTVRFRNVLGLMNSEKIKQDFELRVIRNADQEIDTAVSELVDWFLQRNLNLWEDVMSFVNERRKAGENQIIGEVGGRFQYDRDTLIGKLRESAEEVLVQYDEDAEARRLADRLQNSVFQSGLGLVSGLGLGAAIIALLHGLVLDITGITLGVVVAGIGLFVIPRRRQQAKRELHSKMQELRDGLEVSIKEQFETELQKATDKLRTAIEPYTRFVRSELGRLDELKEDLAKSETVLAGLKQDIDSLEGAAV